MGPRRTPVTRTHARQPSYVFAGVRVGVEKGEEEEEKRNEEKEDPTTKYGYILVFTAILSVSTPLR